MNIRGWVVKTGLGACVRSMECLFARKPCLFCMVGPRGSGILCEEPATNMCIQGKEERAGKKRSARGRAAHIAGTISLVALIACRSLLSVLLCFCHACLTPPFDRCFDRCYRSLRPGSSKTSHPWSKPVRRNGLGRGPTCPELSIFVVAFLPLMAAGSDLGPYHNWFWVEDALVLSAAGQLSCVADAPEERAEMPSSSVAAALVPGTLNPNPCDPSSAFIMLLPH